MCVCTAVALALGSAGAEAALAEKPDTPFDASLVEDLADGRLDSFSLADAVLIASGISGERELSVYRERLDALIAEATSKIVRNASPERRARRLLDRLHRVALKKYEPSADRLADLIDQGSYNCVSATLLYLVAARAMQLDAVAVETPLHVFVSLQTQRRRIDIEATSPLGFDVRRDLQGFRSFMLANKYVTPEEIARRGVEEIFAEFHRRSHPVAPERVIAFLYYNAGIRELQAGHPRAAADRLVNAARVYPGLAYRSEDLRTTLAWSVREQYDAGNFDDAFRLAELAMSFFPDRTTVTDRFAAVGVRMVERAAADGGLTAAERLEARVLEKLDREVDRRKLQAVTAPVLARAALAARDCSSARRHAGRYRSYSPDSIETERFAGWVEDRCAEVQIAGAEAEVGLEGLLAAALASTPEGQDPREYAALVGGIGALAAQGRFDEAVAVGRLLRATLGQGEPRASLDVLLKAVAGRQIATLLRSGRWQDAGRTAQEALRQWPGDDDLSDLRQRAVAGMVGEADPLAGWPGAGPEEPVRPPMRPLALDGDR